MAVAELAMASPILKIIVGAALFFVAPYIVGYAVKVLGVGFLAFAGYKYYLLEALGTPEVILPALVGLLLVFVGRGIAEAGVRVAGVFVVLWGLYGLGVLGTIT